jgi:Ca2+-binding RTX toxin-like protein
LDDADGLDVITYTWLRNGTAISNATQSTYTLTQADVGTRISVNANYTDPLGTAESVSSALTSNVTNANDLPIGNVTISGKFIKDAILTVSNNLTDADGLGKISYQWFNDGLAIPNATQSTYMLTQADTGQSISVKASYVDLQNTAESVSSSDFLITPNSMPTGNAIIKGISIFGSTLSITNTIKDADGIGKLSFTWQNDHGTLSTSPTYALAQTDISTKVWAVVSYTDKKGNFEEVKSNVIDVTVSTKPSAVNDMLIGTDKADKLNGLAGNDTLIGGTGKDTLNGGTGADVFKFNSVADSSALPKQADIITDFKHAQGDKIDLSAIDINTTLAGKQSFIPINAQTFSADATGKLTFDAKTSTLYGSTNSDPAAEFAIVLSGVKSLTADDFIL